MLLVIEPRALCMQSMHSTTQLHSQPMKIAKHLKENLRGIKDE